MEKLRYPIGRFNVKRPISPEQIVGFIQDIAHLPEQVSSTIDGFSEKQLDTTYRPGGWTVRQVVHHLADSHMNSYIRFKLALTEGQPTIKPYEEGRWAELEDGRQAPVELSLQLLTALHQRWTIFLRSLTAEDFEKSFIHPEHGKAVPLDINVALYSWHGRHHLAQILSLKERMNW
ncbi:MAG: YfiT family bacillithiol transferase [Bacteroidota bacterium]